jgi:hypothetical protein
MSLGTFLKKILQGIKKLFEGLKPELKKAIEIGVNIVEKIKDFVASPGADVITMLIPGDVDDKIKEKLREVLPKIFAEMKLVESCAGETDPNKIVECGIKTLQQISGDFQSAFLHDLSILIAQVAADGKLTWSDAVYILQWYYEHHPNSPKLVGK